MDKRAIYILERIPKWIIALIILVILGLAFPSMADAAKEGFFAIYVKVFKIERDEEYTGDNPKFDAFNNALRNPDKNIETDYSIDEFEILIANLKHEQTLDTGGGKRHLFSSSINEKPSFFIYSELSQSFEIMISEHFDQSFEEDMSYDLARKRVLEAFDNDAENLDSIVLYETVDLKIPWRFDFTVSPLSKDNSTYSCDKDLCLPGVLRKKILSQI